MISQLERKKEYTDKMIYLYSLFSSIVCCVIIGYLLSFVPDNTDWDLLEKNVIPNVLSQCIPERAENLQYYCLTILFPVLYLVFIPIYRKRSTKKVHLYTEKTFSKLEFLTAFIIGIIAVLVFTMSETPYSAIKSYSDDYGIILWIIVALIIAYPIYFANKAANKKIILVSYWCFVFAILIFAFSKISAKNYMSTDNLYLTHHYYAWWYPIFKVGSGQTLGVDFNNIYGFYPYVCVVLLRIFGGVNQGNAAILIAALLVGTSFCYYFFSSVFFKNKVLAFITATGASFIGPLSLLKSGTFYFQYFPTRAIVPAASLAIIALDYKLPKKVKTFFRILVSVVLAFGLLWNFESGIIGVIVWAGYLILEIAFNHNFSDKKLWIRIFSAILTSIVSIVLFITIIEVTTYHRTGEIIGKDEIFFGILAFEGTGFFLLPITFGAWILFIISFMAALNVVIPHLGFARKSGEKFIGNKQNLVGLFSVAIVGFGAFSYFVGRSYPTNIFTLTFLMCLISGLLIENYAPLLKRYWKELQNKKTRGNSKFHFLSALSKLTICFIILGLTTSHASIILFDHIRNGEEASFNNVWISETKTDPDYTQLSELAKKIKKWSINNNNGKTPRLLIYWAAYINELNNEKTNYSACEQIDWFYYDNVYTYIECITKNTKEAFVVDYKALSTLEQCFPEEWEDALKNYKLSKTIKWKDIESEEENDYYVYVPNK